MPTLIRTIVCFVALCTVADIAQADTLGIPHRDNFGQPMDVGLLVLGHSTSTGGDWPSKLAQSLNQAQTDGRNYVVFRAITHGDGGFLWSRLSVSPGDPQYDRVKTSSQGTQWCEDSNGVRYSARRAKLEWTLRGTNPAPCTITWDPPLSNDTLDVVSCVWHENGQERKQNLAPTDCWQKMDVKIALIQDTSNRSWPVDDYTQDGMVDASDYFNANAIRSTAAWTCPSNSANPPGTVTTADGTVWIDWNCDKQLTPADAAPMLYAGWLQRLALDLLTRFGPASVQHVFITHKPLEVAQDCLRAFAGETSLCSDPAYPHVSRATTPSRPFTYPYLPEVFWERRAIETLFTLPNLDSRIHLATENDASKMWNRSARCYELGLVASDWAIPASTGRPTTVSADNSEDDAIIDNTPLKIDSNSADDMGCLLHDHIHHNDRGGWMMADIWYGGLFSYLNGQ